MRRSNPRLPTDRPPTEQYSPIPEAANDDVNGNGDGNASPSRFTTPVIVAGAESLKSFDFGAANRPNQGDEGHYGGPVPTLPPPDVAPYPRPSPRPHGGTPRPDNGGGGFDRPVPLPGGSPRPRPQKSACPQNQFAADHSLFGSKNHWWQNWPKTHAYIATMMFFPTTVDEVSSAVRMAETDGMPVRAVGGGWSFSDAALPGNVTTSRPDVATANQLAGWLPLAEGFVNDITVPSAASVDRNDVTLLSYDSHNSRAPAGSALAPAMAVDMFLGGTQPQPVYLINTRSIKSCLQENFSEIMSDEAKRETAPHNPKRRFYFHVEAGITIEELGPLLDAQSPRLALDASGGNPGATLAGSIATGTHGAENNTELLVDRVKAIHMVGPGGLQWWIEGDDSIADPDALMAKYPCLDRSRIISGKGRINGATPQDWLNAVVVSMGCMGAIYSIVLEVAPLIGMREVTSQTTWWNLLLFAKGIPANPVVLPALGPAFEQELRNPATSPVLGGQVAMVVTGGSFSGLIDAMIAQNVYSDLAFNPNRREDDGDFDCWIVNRQNVPVPFDRQPPSGDKITGVVDAVLSSMTRSFHGDIPRLVGRLGQVYGFIDPVVGFLNQLFNPLAPIMNAIAAGVVPGIPGIILGQALSSGNPFPLVNMVTRIASAADTLDVALDAITKPMAQSGSSDLAQPFLTGFLASTLGTAARNPNVAIGTNVGSVGFPNDGLIGAGIEIALPPTTAFQFLQTQILDKMIPQMPFFGYVSIRLCKSTKAFLGMPQWGPLSVMIEVVSFGDPRGQMFVMGLQADTINAINAGTLDAMLHWGLENEMLSAATLSRIPAMNVATTAFDETNPGVMLTKLNAFKMIRNLIRSGNGTNAAGLFRAFDNKFTTRLGL